MTGMVVFPCHVHCSFDFNMRENCYYSLRNSLKLNRSSLIHFASYGVAAPRLVTSLDLSCGWVITFVVE